MLTVDRRGFSLFGVHKFSGIGQALRRLRKDAGLTQEGLAQRAKIGAAKISKYEREQSSPNLKTLDALLAALDIDLRGLADALDIASGRAAVGVVAEPAPPWPADEDDAKFLATMLRARELMKGEKEKR